MPRKTGEVALKRGPKGKYTEELKEQFFEAIAAGLTERDACWANGFDECTLARWKHGEAGAPEDFWDQLKQVKARRTMQWLNIVRRKAAGRIDENGKYIVEPNLTAALELIDRCAPDYRKNPRYEVSGPGGAPMRPEASVLSSLNFSVLSPREQFLLAELLDKVAGGTVLDAEIRPIAPSANGSQDE